MKRRETAAPSTGARRTFTRSELAEIRVLVAVPASKESLDRLYEIHSAAGRHRMVRAWECDMPGDHDPVFAYREEIEDIDPDWSPPWSGPKAR